ncbi:energy-coupling factor transporter ATPase [Anaeromicropila populeti]|uniref:Energy-coupling factor transporter ATP-binding protein EcfA2 n=1 Tax=Anaeromicropila populeti TaxID=37658 RepID=A0A1I6IC79_9FIRM|nr:energy-coupling factor transporter ATPase [Anaeromicropila populeti]SFR64303.1 energy-coupling factor transport system ATP-binding protein [Anaeromicropila populeti]
MSIRLEHVNYVYSSGTAYEKHAVKDLNITIESGEFIGIIGHTGSGKSTLTQLLNGLIKATDGHIYYNDKSIYDKKFDMRQLRGQVGLVFQYPEHQLFETSIIRDVSFGPANMGLAKDEIEKRAKMALMQVGIGEDLFEASPFELSGGQRRRAAIAGVLAMEPSYLILDEPTAGLDPKGREEILELIRWLHETRHITVLLVSHSMEDVAEYVNRIIVMNHGQIAFDGVPKEVFKNYRELEKIGLAAPQVTYVMNQLKDNGFQVETDAVTVEEAYEAIKVWARKEGVIL